MASGSGRGKRKENPSENNECFRYGNNNGSSSTITLGPFPVGYKFDPTDEELIAGYLWPKVHNKKLPPNLMHDIDLYDPERCTEYTPEQLSARYAPQGKDEWYFFTPRDKKYPKGTRPNRAAGGGYWKASSRDEKIMSNGKLIGHRKSLVFHKGKQPSGIKTNWIMHEFCLGNDHANSPQHREEGGNDRHTNSPHRLEQSGNSSKRNKLDDWVLCRIHYNTKGAKQAKQATQEANIDDTVDNTMINPAQFLGYPSNDPHQSGLWGVPPTLEDVKVTYDNNPVTMPTHYYNNLNYHLNGQSNAYSTLEDVKLTYDNTVTIPTQFTGYHPTDHPHQSGVLSSGPSNANSKPEDVHFTNDNTVTVPTQFAGYQSGVLSSGPSNANPKPEDVHFTNDNTVTIPTQFAGYHPTHHPQRCGVLASGPSNAISKPEDVYITNDNTVTISTQFANNPTGNTGSVNPILATPSEFGGEDDLNVPMSYLELFDDMELPDFEAGFDDDLFDDFNFDDESLTNVIVS